MGAERGGGVIDFDLGDPDHVRDPYPVFAGLREAAPVHWSDSLGGWMLTRYADVAHVLRSPVFSADTISPFIASQAPLDADIARLGRLVPHWAVFTDPPDHTRLRTALNQGFTNRQVSRLRGFVEDVTDGLLAPLAARTEADFVRQFAYPLPALVIARLLGVPDEHVERFKEWSDDLGEFITTGTSPQRYSRASAAMEQMADYFAVMVRQRRARPADDLLTPLVAALDAGVMASEDELVSNCILLLFAGHETTTNLLANGLYHLVSHPDQLARLRREPSLYPSAVEEIFRFDNPVHGLTRIVIADTAIDGTPVCAGDRVFAFITAANRDPAVHPDPDRLDVARDPNRHLGFGLGIHFCLGAPLARLEATVALPRVVEAFPAVRVTEQPTWKPLLVLRAMDALAIEYEPA